MKLIRVDNTELSIVDLESVKIAFSYQTPIAILLTGTAFITYEHFSKTTTGHKSKIAKIWAVDAKESAIDANTFNKLLKALRPDVDSLIVN